MSPLVAALLAFAAYGLATGSTRASSRGASFALDPEAETPAHALRDEVDYVPARPAILFGHHFASITGLAPMLGPAIAVIWGWVPALLWVVLGACLIGCVHDFAALVVSIRNRGLSVGQVADAVLGPRCRTLFHFIIFFGVALAMGVFVLVIAQLFAQVPDPATGTPGYSTAVAPSAILMVVALVSAGCSTARASRSCRSCWFGFGIELVSIRVGIDLPTLGLPAASWPARRGG